MTKEGKKAWTISAIIHVSAAVLLLVAGLISGCSDSKADQHVFELVAPEGMDDFPMQDSGESSGEVALPDVDVNAPDISPDLPPAEEPLPVVSEVPPVVVTDKPKKEEPKKVAYDPNKYTPKTQPKTTPKNNSNSRPKITLKSEDVRISSGGKTGNITGGPGIPGGTKGGTGLSNDEWSRFIISMRTIIQSNWDQPTDLYADKLYAVVEFTVSKNGTISNVRIVKSSGNSRFDATVRSAFNNTRNVGTVPSGQSEDFSLRFEMD